MPSRIETFNGLRPFEVACRWFEIFSNVNPVNLRAYDRNGHEIANELAVTVGFRLDRRGVDGQGKQLTGIARVEIETGALEAVGFFYSDGTAGYVSRTDIADRVGRQLGTLSSAAHTVTAHTISNPGGQVKAVNAARRYLSIQVASGQPAGIRVRTDGGVAADDNTSMEILPGQTFVPAVPPTGQINAIRKGGVDIAITVIEA